MLTSFFRFVVRYVNVFRPRVCYEKNHTSHALLNLRASRSDLMPHVLFFLCVLVTRLSRFWKKTFTNKKKVGFNPQISYKRTIQKTWWLEYIRGLTQTSMNTNSWALNIWHEEIMQFLARSVRKGKLYNGAMHNICYPNLRSLWIHEDVFVENESFFSNIRIEPCRIKNSQNWTILLVGKWLPFSAAQFAIFIVVLWFANYRFLWENVARAVRDRHSVIETAVYKN